MKRLLLLFLMWATPSTFKKVLSPLNSALLSLSPEDWLSIDREYRAIGRRLQGQREITLANGEASAIFAYKSHRLCAFIGQRLDHLGHMSVMRELIQSDIEFDSVVRNFIYRGLWTRLRKNSNWDEILPLISKLYLSGTLEPPLVPRDTTLPKKIAEAISKAPENYPLPLVSAADSSLRSAAGGAMSNLAHVAEEGKWFALPTN